jgi:hypothetical protein
MDKFKCFDGGVVDLDNAMTYQSDFWKPLKHTWDLHTTILSELGRAIYYMKYLHPSVDWGKQAVRIDRYCKQYAKEWGKYIKDTPAHRKWLRKFLFKFTDEVENMC